MYVSWFFSGFGWWVVGGLVGLVGFGLVGFACLCKQVTWLVAYLYPTQKHQPFRNCFGFHWVKHGLNLDEFSRRTLKKHLQRKHTPAGV